MLYTYIYCICVCDASVSFDCFARGIRVICLIRKIADGSRCSHILIIITATKIMITLTNERTNEQTAWLRHSSGNSKRGLGVTRSPPTHRERDSNISISAEYTPYRRSSNEHEPDRDAHASVLCVWSWRWRWLRKAAAAPPPPPAGKKKNLSTSDAFIILSVETEVTQFGTVESRAHMTLTTQ